MRIAGRVEIEGDRIIVDGTLLPFAIGPEATMHSAGGVLSVTVTIPCLTFDAATVLEEPDDEVHDIAELRRRDRLKAKGPQRAS